MASSSLWPAVLISLSVVGWIIWSIFTWLSIQAVTRYLTDDPNRKFRSAEEQARDILDILDWRVRRDAE